MRILMDDYNFNPIIKFCLDHGLCVSIENGFSQSISAVITVRGKGKIVRFIANPYHYDEFAVVNEIYRVFEITAEDRVDNIGRITWEK